MIGSAGNPLTLGCGQQAYDGAPLVPGPRDLVIGPLDIIGGKVLATADPAGYGEHGDYKVPVAVGPGATVRVVIGPPARGHVVIQNPYGPSGGVAAAVYHSCSAGWTVFPQSFAFLGQRTRGCVPLEVQAAGQAKARHVTVSLFAGRCRP